MAWAWEELVRLYDKLKAVGKPVCPIAHTYLGYMSHFIGYMVKLSNDKIKPPEKANNVVCVDFKGACCPEWVQAPFLCQQIIV